MSKNELSRKYFDWLFSFVYDKRYSSKTSYSKLLHHLHRVDFRYIIPMDGNRADDGMNMRYRYGYDRHLNDAVIASYLDDRPCSVLEMLVALSLRCEEEIMSSPDEGDRTGQWFWGMIVNLGLGLMDDVRYDENIVNEHLDRFMERRYSRDGSGGLFTIEDCDRDLRDLEIWHQMCWYLNKI